MAVVMSFTMSLFQTVVRIGLAPGMLTAWLTSFAIGLIVAIPTAIVVAPRAQRLVRHLTRAPTNRRRTEICSADKEAR
jgi:integral membrane sensor domain MASE1